MLTIPHMVDGKVEYVECDKAEYAASFLVNGTNVKCVVTRETNPQVFIGVVKRHWNFEGLHIDVHTINGATLTVMPRDKEFADLITRLEEDEDGTTTS